MFPQPDIRNEYYAIFASDMDDLKTSEIFTEHYIPFKRLLGKYNGKEETSYIANLKDMEHIASLSVIDNQESILFLSPEFKFGRKAKLIYKNNMSASPTDFTFVDTYFRDTDEFTAKSQDSYTYDPSTNTYYIVK